MTFGYFRGSVTGSGGGSASWQPLRVGAGGFIRSMDVALSDNTMVNQTDTYGGWLWNPSIPAPNGTTGMWTQLCVPTAFVGTDLASKTPDGQETYAGNGGVWTIRVANSNTSIFYMGFLGSLYKSTNRGVSWTNISNNIGTISTMPPNSGTSQNGHHLAIDPINPNRFIFSTNTTVYESTTGSGPTSISTSSIPACSTGVGYAVAYDPRTAAQSGGNTQIVYVFCDGHGLYKSIDGGSTWAIQNASGMPTTMRDLVVNPNNGDVWVVDGGSSQSNVYKYNGTAWSAITATSVGVPFQAVAFDPTNSNNIVLVSTACNLLQLGVSNNAGSSFTQNLNGTLVANDIPWLALDQPGLDPGRLMYDNTGAILISEGIGVWKISATPTTTSSFNFVSQSAGIEQLITNQIISPPGGNPVVASWDRAAFVITNPKVYPSTYYPGSALSGTPTDWIIPGWGVDYASADPTFLCVYTDGINFPYSTNKGATWSQMANIPPSRQGGAIAASTNQNMVAISSNNGTIYYTLNRGTSAWVSLESYFNTNFGVPLISSGYTGWGNAYYDNRQYVCADRVAATTFYAYNDNAGGNLFRSTDGGQTWTKRNASAINFVGNYGNLKSVPQLGSTTGTTGHLFFTGGSSGPPHPNTVPLYRSTDGGVTWTTVANVKEAMAIGFGVNDTSSAYPAVGFVGWYNGVAGVWVSKDNCVTFTSIGPITMYGTSDMVSTMAGDSNTANIWYVGLHSSGSAYYGP